MMGRIDLPAWIAVAAAAALVAVCGIACGDIMGLEHNNPYDPKTPSSQRAKANPPADVECPVNDTSGDSILVQWTATDQPTSLSGHVVHWDIEGGDEPREQSGRVPAADEEARIDGLDRATTYRMTVSAIASGLRESEAAPSGGIPCEIIPKVPGDGRGVVYESQYPARTPTSICIERNGAKGYVVETDQDNIHVLDVDSDAFVAAIGGSANLSEILCDPADDRAYAFEESSDEYGRGVVRVVDTVADEMTGDILATSRPPRGGTVTPDGRYLVVTGETQSGTEGWIQRIDLQVGYGDDPAFIDQGPGPVVLASGKFFVLHRNQGVVSVLDEDDFEIVERISLRQTARGEDLATTEDGRMVLISSDRTDGSGQLTLLSSADLEPIGDPYEVGQNPGKIAVCDGIAYVVDVGDGGVSIFNVGRRQVLYNTIAVEARPRGIVTTLDCDKLYVTNSASGTISIRTYE